MDTAIVTALIGVTGGLVGVWIGGTRGSTSIIGGWHCLLKTCATVFISHHLQKMLTWANFVNTELKKGFTAVQAAEKHA